nr:hypothetical protein Iba_chr08aCG11990 [Ipomoea batatas]
MAGMSGGSFWKMASRPTSNGASDVPSMRCPHAKWEIDGILGDGRLVAGVELGFWGYHDLVHGHLFLVGRTPYRVYTSFPRTFPLPRGPLPPLFLLGLFSRPWVFGFIGPLMALRVAIIQDPYFSDKSGPFGVCLVMRGGIVS